MNINQLAGQHILIGLSGPVLTTEEKIFITENNISGVVLNKKNCLEPKQIRELCLELQQLRHKMVDRAPLFIGVDMEGGRVQTLSAPFTNWPALKKIGDLDAPTVAFHLTQRMGAELLAIGINLNFAPCVDVFSNSKNTGIGDRAVSSDPLIVEKMASALVRGYIKSGVLSCAKHFPGYGNTLSESGELLPTSEADLATLLNFDLVPFKKALRSRVDMVMSSPALFKNVDPNWPVMMSEVFITKLLRDELRYKGLAVASDLDNSAVIKHYDKEQIAVKSIQAGNDLLMYCQDLSSPALAIESITTAIVQGAIQKSHLEYTHQRIMDVKKIKIIRPDPIDLDEALQIIGSDENKYLAECIENLKMPEGLVEAS